MKRVEKGQMSKQADQKGQSAQNRMGRGAGARHKARRSWSVDPGEQVKPQVELEGEC